MSQTEFYIPFLINQSFYASEWSPPGKSKAVILLIHGLSDHADRVTCPLLLMHGTDDHLTDFTATREFSEKMIAEHAFKAWEGLYHELHNEISKETILCFIRDWIEKKIL